MFRLKMKPSCSISNSLDKFLSDRNDEIVFGFGSEQKDVVGWMRITRDVATDIDKVLSMKKSPHKYKKTSFSIFLLQLSCHGQVTNISLGNAEHLRMFWYMRNQDKSGGWPAMFGGVQ